MEENKEVKGKKEEEKDSNGTKPPNNLLGGKKPRFNAIWIYGLIGVAIILIYFFDSGQGPTVIDWKFFRNELLLKGEVEKIQIVNEQNAEIYIKEQYLNEPKHQKNVGKGFTAISKTGPQYTMPVGSNDIFKKMLDDAQAGIPDEARIYPEYIRKRTFGDTLYVLLPIIILVVIYMIIFRRMSGGTGGGGGTNIFNVGKSKARIFDKDENIRLDFKDVAGLEEAKMEIKEIVDFLKKPKKYTDLGGKIPKGALLVGPPGTGKTLLAKAVAGEAHVPFFSLSGSDFVEMFVGVGASRVRDLFKQAKEKAPCIVFIDEIDAIGRARGRNPNFGANDERENTLNQVLDRDGWICIQCRCYHPGSNQPGRYSR